MTAKEFEHYDWEKKVDCVLEVEDHLDAECFCKSIAGPGNELNEGHKYKLTVNGNCNVTEYTAYTWDEEEEVQIDDLLEEYGVYDWTDLPMNDEGCRFCPERYDCDIVRKTVEQFTQMYDD